MAFILTDFLRHSHPSSWSAYCKDKGIDFEHEPSEGESEVRESFLKLFDTLDVKTQRQLEFDFQEIENLSSNATIQSMIDEAKLNHRDIPEKALDGKAQRDVAFWFYLNQHEIFDQVAIENEFMDRSGWKTGRTTKESLREVLRRKDKLAAALSQYYWETEMKGRNCIVECFEKDDRAFFVAYPEDYAQSEVTYEGRKLNRKSIRKPVFKVYYVYEPLTGRLSAKAKGGWKKVKGLRLIFCQSVLGQKEPVEQDWVYELNVLKNPSIEFLVPPEDKVEFVWVKSVSLKTLDGSERTTIDLLHRSYDGIRGIHEACRRRNIDWNGVNITSAAIQVKFEPLYKNTNGSVTVQLTSPNGDNLTNSVLHQKVRQYLQTWGIDTLITDEGTPE